jgi:hypothetical protein
VESGLDVNTQNKVRERRWLCSPHRRPVLLLRWLSEGGAGGGQFGDTALQCATRCGHVDLVDYLCTVGANVAVEGMRAKTALEWAAFLGQVCAVPAPRATFCLTVCSHRPPVRVQVISTRKAPLTFRVHTSWSLAPNVFLLPT